MTPFDLSRQPKVGKRVAPDCGAMLFHGWFLISTSALLLVLFSFSLTHAAEKSVLFVHTQKSNASGVVAFDKTFEAALTAGSSDRINLYYEYTDLWRFSGDEYQRALRDFYRQKYAGQHLDLVVIDSPPALKFLLAYGEELFPGTPVVFCAMEGRLIEGLHLKQNFTGILAGLDFKKSLASALQLQPETRRVLVVGGTSELDKSYIASAQQDFRTFEGQVDFTYLSNLPIEEIERRVAQPPPHSIIFGLPFSRDGAGHWFTPRESAARVAKASNAPYYNIIERLVVPGGGVGGYLWSSEAEAMETARLARRILAGEKPQDIPVYVGDTNRYIFDWRQLQRWRISETRLPPGSILRNKDLTFWERYKWYVLGALALTIAQALLIAILLVQRARRARAEKALRERLEFEKMLSELSASFVNLPVEEIDETIDRHLREVVKVTGVDGCNIFEFSSDYAEASITHRYDARGRAAPFSVIKFDQFPWYLNKLHSGSVVRVRDINADLPEEAVAERKAAREAGIRSVLTVPIAISQTVTSAISVFTAFSYRDWAVELEMRLRLVGEIFVQAMLRKRTEEALRATEARVRRLLDSNIIGVIHSDGSGKVIDANNAFLELIGFTREELDAGIVRWADMTPQEYRDLDELGIEEAKTRGACTPYEKEYIRKDGTRVAVLLGYALLDTVKDDYVCFVLDLTQTKQAEQELRDALSEVQRLRDQLQQENIYLQNEIALEHNFHEIVGQSDEVNYTLFKIEQVAPTDATVLILGETGTGKELVARAIHGAGPRKERPLLKINCATLPANLIESELFGHERGAFTGAHARKIGRFEAANGATLFLDEIGELPLDLQPKLLRVLQEGEFERVGGGNTIKVDVRIIAATNRNLKTEVQKGFFREDLWYRLSVFPITVPPLRQRKGDITLLVNHFVDKFNRKLGKAVISISPTTLKDLENHSWPGNVRELANVIERAVINSQGPALQLADRLDEGTLSSRVTDNGSKSLIEVERSHIVQVLESTGWKISGNRGAARILGLNPSTLRTRMIKLRIQRPPAP